MQKSEPVRLAKYAIEEHISSGLVPVLPEWVTDHLRSSRAGCFVSLHNSDGSLRGCIGTISPLSESLGLEIIRNAISASSRDPRFPPVKETELHDLEITVDVLSEPEEATPKDLDPERYGVIVEKGWKKGVLLPDLEGIETAQEQLRIALLKAGIAEKDEYDLFRFTVKRYY